MIILAVDKRFSVKKPSVVKDASLAETIMIVQLVGFLLALIIIIYISIQEKDDRW
jgi:hypothetical protein